MKYRRGMIKTPVQPGEIKEAKRIHAERMKACGGQKRVMTEHQWIGALGELVFDRFLDHMMIDHEWLKYDNASGIDFVIGDLVVDTKAQNTKGWFKETNWCNVPKRQAPRETNNYVGDFFFLSFDYESHDMWLCGGTRRADFARQAEFVRKGQVRGGMKRGAPADLYCIQQKELLDPIAWTRTLPADCLPEF